MEIIDVPRLRLVEVDAPPLSPDVRGARDAAWDAAVAANPALFDGPVTVCAGLRREGPDELVLTWARATYRYFALRRVPGAVALPSLSADVVQPTDDGRVLAGLMAASTAHAGRWQLPGGTIEPPGEGEALDEAEVRRQAARELWEEVGVDAAQDSLHRIAVVRGATNVAVVFRAPPLPEADLRARHSAQCEAELARGRDPELTEITTLDPAGATDLDEPWSEKLIALLGS